LPTIDYREVSQLHSRTACLNRQVDEQQSPHAFGTDGAFRLRFPAPLTGPIAVGHSCHFGLRLLLPAGTME
jgi:CRISPR-associated protein Csb2